jgi:hypothetical protein
VVVQHAQVGQRIRSHLTAGIVRQTLVALCSCDARVSNRAAQRRDRLVGRLTGRLSYM